VHHENGGWVVIGTTGHDRFGSGAGRTRIPSELWEDHYPNLPLRPGHLWGDRAQWVAEADVVEHIGWAPPALRALAARPIVNLRPSDRNAFLRLTSAELAEAGHESHT
jgi:hypothetical protein